MSKYFDIVYRIMLLKMYFQEKFERKRNQSIRNTMFIMKAFFAMIFENTKSGESVWKIIIL